MDRRSFLSLVPVGLVGGILSEREAAADVPTSQLFAGTIRSLKECYSPSSDSLRYVSWASSGPLIVKPLETFADKADATFRVVPGLSDSRFVSFEFIRRPGYYLVAQPFQGSLTQVHHALFAGRLVDAEAFRRDATFDVRPGGMGSSSYRVESVARRPAVLASYWRESHRTAQTPILVGTTSTSVYYGPGPDCGWCDNTLGDFSNFVFTRPHMASFSFRSKNFPDRYMRHRNFLGELTTVAPVDEFDATFVVVPGIADKRMISLEAKNFPGLYLRHQNLRMRLSMLRDLGDGNDGTFRLVDALDSGGLGWVSLESRNFPGYYLRHKGFQLWLDRNDGTPLFRADASFEMAEPKAR